MVYKIILQKGLQFEEESKEPVGAKSFHVKRHTNSIDQAAPNFQPSGSGDESPLPVMSKTVMEKRLAYLQKEE